MLLEVNHLTIEFHDRAQSVMAVRDVNFQMEEGQILGLVGESGSGKSQTALAIAGLLSRHDIEKSGEILFEGENLLNCPRHILRAMQGDDIGVVFQEPMTALNPVKKIGWQVEESLRIHRELSKQERREKALEMLAQVELPDPEKVYQQYPHELSGGMRQRVCLAAAMICEPKLLIADEPTTALDVTIQAQIMALLRNLQKESGMSMILITHDIGLVASMADRVIVMYAGQMIEEAPVKELFAAPAHPYTKALLQTVPGIYDEKDRELVAIPGMVPENYDSIPGCRFADRCAFRTKDCDQPQSYRQIGEGHFVRCMLAKEGET